MPDGVVDERDSTSCGACGKNWKSLPLSDFKQLVREQLLMLLIDERRAVEAIPSMLDGDPRSPSLSSKLDRMIEVVGAQSRRQGRAAEIEALLASVVAMERRKQLTGKCCARYCPAAASSHGQDSSTIESESLGLARTKKKSKLYDGLSRPEDLKMIASDAEMAEVGKENRLKKQKAQQEAELREHLCRDESRLSNRSHAHRCTKRAAFLQILRSRQADGGRRINWRS